MWRTVAAWALAGAVAVWTAARLMGLERGYPLVPLAAFTPHVTLLAIAACGIALLLRRPGAAAVALAGAVALGSAVAPRAVGGPTGAAGPDGPRVGVLTVNLLVGRAEAAPVVELVRRTGADVLSLQEATPGALARLRASGLRRLLPHRVERAGQDSGGMALYAAVPLAPRRVPGGFWTPPIAARARFAGGPPLELWAVHPPAPFNAARVRGLREDLRALPPAGQAPLRVLAGDFNSTLDHAELRRLVGRGYEDAAEQVGAGLEPTWPAGRRFPPPVTIDHVLVDARIGVREVRVTTLPDTDHRAVFAELVLPAAGAGEADRERPASSGGAADRPGSGSGGGAADRQRPDE